jgi:hypothetical protein
LLTLNSIAQTRDSDSAGVYNLKVISKPVKALVYIDTTMIGKTPINSFALKEDTYTLKIINPVSSKSWEEQNFQTELTLSSDTVIEVQFDYFYFFNSNPFDASVLLQDSLLGLTPLRYFSKEKLFGNLLFRKKNYSDRIFNLKNYNFETGCYLNLEPLTTNTDDIVYKNRDTEFKTKRNFIVAGSFGAAAIISGYTTIKFKNIANNSYDRYLIYYDQKDLDDANRNDIFAAISLVVMQAALALAIYFLIVD